MKKLLFGLIATVLFSATGNAQKVTQESVRLQLANAMVSFTNAMKPAYSQAKNFDDFEKIVCGDWSSTNSKEGHALLQASYNLIAKKTTDAEIVRSYSGKEMAAVALLHNENLKNNINSSGIEVFGGTTGDFNPYTTNVEGRCRWYQIACWFEEIFGPVAGPKILNFLIETGLNSISGGGGN
jgi:hypothetical protein